MINLSVLDRKRSKIHSERAKKNVCHTSAKVYESNKKKL